MFLSAAAAAAMAGVTAFGTTASADEPVVLSPIGGGYVTSTLQGFARLAADGASGPTIDLVVVPSSYGDSPKDRKKNLSLAQDRTDQLDAACEAIVAAPYTGCTATLAVLLDRSDALDPANSAGLDADGTDGIYILGGDQGIAMQVLADTPAEEAMTRVVARGVAVGGTSAGAAVQSRSMINGPTGNVGPQDGLQRNSTLMWWGDDADLERGLAFGSEAAIFDQHFYQRGRFGRLLSTIATSDERFDGASRLGVGVDYATGLVDTGDVTLSGAYGQSSAALIDLETLGVTPAWRGTPEVLSARGILTHLMTPGDVAYDIPSRTLSIAGSPVATPAVAPRTGPSLPTGAGTVVLGGDLSADLTTGAAPFVTAAQKAAAAGADSRIVVISASAGDKKTAAAYAAGLADAGWAGSVDRVVWTKKGLPPVDLKGAAGVVVVAADPTTLSGAMGDSAFRGLVTLALREAPSFLADQHLTAALGSWWSPRPNPTSLDLEDQGIAAFRAGDGDWQPGLGLVDGIFVPRLTEDYRWGRLYDATRHSPDELAYGLGAGTALVLSSEGATVTGGGSVVVADGRGATFWTADNGAIGAANVVLDVLAPGEVLATAE